MERITSIDMTGIKLIKKWEGFSATPYLCPSGVPTIGYGTTYYPDGRRVKMTDFPITEAQATFYLTHNVKNYEFAVDSMTRDDLTQNQFNALVSLTYNIGAENFKRSTLLKQVNNNPSDQDIARQFLRWNRSEGRVLSGLTARRREESLIYFMI